MSQIALDAFHKLVKLRGEKKTNKLADAKFALYARILNLDFPKNPWTEEVAELKKQIYYMPTFIGGHIAKYRHGQFLALLTELARRVGAYARTEAGDIFGSVLAAHPAAFRLYRGGLKTIAFCKARRADTLPGERLNELIKIDRDIFRMPAGQSRPMEARTLTFCPPGGDPFTPLVVDSFGEMSLEVGAFVGDLASKGAHALRGCLCAPSVKLARAALLWKMRQELGITSAAATRHTSARRFGADDNGGAEAWSHGAHHQRQESRSWHE
ncbi:hypothetical protein T492DRAFT_894577 [Pavlovales sp. CCMP2436]|nr:hypothetical protein T492DRAFT_894577 [Pavlovales sp. CCMP2436]